MLMAEESLGVVFELGEKGSSMLWHLGGMLGGEQQKYLLHPIQLCILEWYLELLLDLCLLALSLFLWLHHVAPHHALCKAPQSSADSPTPPGYKAGSGQYHCSPCRYV